MNKCEVCDNKLDGPILSLGNYPLPDDLTNNLDLSTALTKYKQELICCSTCLTVHQSEYIPKTVLFKKDYHYRASLTKDVINGMRELVDSVNSLRPLDDSSVVLDIGSNDGSLLNIFKENFNSISIGVEPTDAILESQNLDYSFNEFFDKKTVEKINNLNLKIDVITFTNVFAHIENLNELLENLSNIMHSDTLLVIENHYLGEIINRNQFDSFYLEHPRTYSVESFKHIANKLNRKIENIQFPKRYGGNIRVFISNKKSNFEVFDKFNVNDFNLLSEYFINWKKNASEFVEKLNMQFIGKSLPARAVMLIHALGLDKNTMPTVYEQDKSPKVNKFVPGTNINILKDSEMYQDFGKPIIIWSWHIQDEIINYLKQINYNGDVYVPLPKFEKIITI